MGSLGLPEQNTSTVTRAKKTVVLSIVGLALLLAGSFLAVDWMIYIYDIRGNLYAGVAKPALTLLCLVLVLLIGRDCVDRRDRLWLLLAFLCMFPTDVLMSIVALTPGMPVDSPVFMAGGVLSILAHGFLIVRFVRRFRAIPRGAPTPFTFGMGLWLPVAVYASAAILVAVLWKDLERVGHLVIGPIYTAFFCTTTWFAWETLRHRVYPRPNAVLAGVAATCWYATEIVGEIYNLGLGEVSRVAFRLVWVFYGTNIVLLALSGYRWDAQTSEGGSTR